MVAGRVGDMIARTSGECSVCDCLCVCVYVCVYKCVSSKCIQSVGGSQRPNKKIKPLDKPGY